ncbi:MAG: extracellular solute-binding protein [Oscillospiraceae bacterium]|nr:extracellular solute-binding protein [Oscillospiraceae bacterium]
MKKLTSRILAGVIAAASMASFSACSGDNGDNANTPAEETTTTTAKTEWTGDNIEVTVDEGALSTDVDISGKTLKWMGFYDLNPTNDSPERSTELALFEDTYGAKIEYIPTTNSTQFDDLATAIVGGTSPDIFVYDWRSFPYDINKGQYQPIDSLVDWEDPMWADVKDQADMFIWKGEHYVAPFGYGFNDFQILMYNKTVVEEMGFDDPYELYLEGKWDWDVFVDMMKQYAEADSANYGIAGWWANAFVYTSGDTMVKYDGNKFTNNLYSDKIEKAQLVIEDIWKSGLVKRGWVPGDQAFTSGDTLFYSMGTWAYNAAQASMPDDVIQIVPFPKEPGSDTYYMNKRIFSHMWVKGSENADCVKAWFNVNRLVNYDEKYTEITKQKFLTNNTAWTSEMYDLVMSYYDDNKFKLAYDYGYGISEYMNSDIMTLLYEGIVNEQFESWVQAREEIMNIVDSEIAIYN